jgi:hypothetical protein
MSVVSHEKDPHKNEANENKFSLEKESKIEQLLFELG